MESSRDINSDRSEVGLIAREFKLKKPPDQKIVLTIADKSCNTVAHDMCQFRSRKLSGGVLLSAILTCA